MKPFSGSAISPPKILRVLVVDDYPDNAESMALLLRCDGHDVAVARDGLAALRMAQAKLPHVMLVDISMPGMSGYEVAKRMRQAYGRRTRLIAITAHGFEADRKKCGEAGFDYYFVKPADPAVVQKLLRRLAASL